MLTVAYLANQFPSAVEPYVADEIVELRRRGVRVIAGSVKRNSRKGGNPLDLTLFPISIFVMARAVWLCIRRGKRLVPVIARIVLRGREGAWQRLKALVHTFLGACYAVQLAEQQSAPIDHIHVHHGYFGSWVGMTAAKLLGIPWSMTLHGSDLLLHGAWLDYKFSDCAFCFTVSEYNRRYILERYRGIDPRKILVARLGVDLPSAAIRAAPLATNGDRRFTLLAVGRLHAVKDHAFLVHACARLAARGIPLHCLIAGEGPERRNLEHLIRDCGAGERVILLGHVPREQMSSLYDRADVVVLTSRSEGIPLVLMEAMARGKIVLAPAITGIPELVVANQTGFLYKPGSMDDFIERVRQIRALMLADGSRSRPNFYVPSAACVLGCMSHAAQVQVRHNFNRKTNLKVFTDLFLQRVAGGSEAASEVTFDESSVLQQIQLCVQRDGSLSV